MQRFYGGDPESWLRMPGSLLAAYTRMLGRLEAEEALAGVHQTAAGSGTMHDQDRRDYLDELRREAEAGRRRRAPKPSAEMLRRLNVNVRPPEGVKHG